MKRLSPWIFAASALVSLVGGSNLDLHVYVAGGAALPDMYTVAIDDNGSPTPFVYPPFAALMFWPLHLVPFWLVVLVWRVAMIAAVYASIRFCRNMTGKNINPFLWSAVALWVEPVVGNIKIGNIGVFMMVMVLYAAYVSRPWLSGLLVGLATGIKITPAISSLFFIGQKRYSTVFFSVVAFAVTYLIGFLATGKRFFDYIGQDGLFRYCTAGNQSWRGAVSRIAGHEVKGLPLALVILLTGVLAFLAWRALDDALGRLLVVMMFGLCASPISWTNHWTWIVPLLVWLPMNWLWWAWFLPTMFALPYGLSLLESHPWVVSRPWYLAWAAAVYPLLTLATYAWILISRRRSPGQAEAPSAGGLAA